MITPLNIRGIYFMRLLMLAFCTLVPCSFSLPVATSAQDKWPCVCVGDSETQRRIEAALDVVMDVDFAEAPLSEVVSSLSSKNRIPILIDTKALEDAGLGVDFPITFTARQISLRAALTHMLGEPDLTWLVRDDVLQVTTPDVSSRKEYICLYNVADIADEGEELELLTQVIRERFLDGSGDSETRLTIGNVLIINGNRERQDQVAEFLAALHKAQHLRTIAEQPNP